MERFGEGEAWEFGGDNPFINLFAKLYLSNIKKNKIW
jgi:hypothetical protein